MIDYHVELIKFPSSKTHEAVTINEDGSATIFLNKNDTREQQQRRFLHAMKHLHGDDFKKVDAQEIEVTLPATWIREMGVTEELREVKISFDGKK